MKTKINVKKRPEWSDEADDRISRSRLVAYFAESKNAFLRRLQHESKSQADERLTALALNEAEAAAWQTEFPYLVFPALAEEKVRALSNWTHRQESVLRTQRTLAFAE